MPARQTFSLARLLFGLVGVSIVCTAISLLPKPWAPHWIWPYIYLLVLPSIGYGWVFYWSRIFANLDALQRGVIGSLLGLFLALGFSIAIIECLAPISGAMFYKPPTYESELESGTVPLQDVRYGYHGDQLVFVVFQTSVNGESRTELKITPITAPNNTGIAIPHHDHWIQLPNGTRKDLSSSRMMFEYDLGGAFKSRPIDVTLDELRAWIASYPEIYSIENVEEFVAHWRTLQRM